jgi:hypothetical protein
MYKELLKLSELYILNVSLALLAFFNANVILEFCKSSDTTVAQKSLDPTQLTQHTNVLYSILSLHHLLTFSQDKELIQSNVHSQHLEWYLVRYLIGLLIERMN